MKNAISPSTFAVNAKPGAFRAKMNIKKIAIMTGRGCGFPPKYELLVGRDVGVWISGKQFQ
ncbi:hypothetical protein FACS1894107_14760 [Planctomycetales bacterium]|nr:hypothetical protein FACS1894107_14760 [Planctomycetales bacterium]GHS98563.1 hypothetical protein FACS1894108_06940 [Planctomycetales bacterium]